MSNNHYFTLQMWLILTGKIDVPWAPNWYQFKDWNGNPIYIPTTACFSLCFSVLAMIKAVVYFNIARVHVSVSIRYNWHKSFTKTSCIFKPKKWNVILYFSYFRKSQVVDECGGSLCVFTIIFPISWRHWSSKLAPS